MPKTIMNAECDEDPLDDELSEEKPDSEVESEAVTRDRELYAELLRTDFAGPRYDVWAGQMWTYAIRVLTGWLRSGEISEQCARRRIRISINSVELEIFERNAEVRSTLAIEAVMAAGADFTERALRGAVGTPTRGRASSRTSWERACSPSATSSRSGPAPGCGRSSARRWG